MKKKYGIELIAEERIEQMEKHGRTIQSDVQQNTHRQLSIGAMGLITRSTIPPTGWDEEKWAYMINKAYKERLIIAGALIAADIDRLNAIEK